METNCSGEPKLEFRDGPLDVAYASNCHKCGDKIRIKRNRVSLEIIGTIIPRIR